MTTANVKRALAEAREAAPPVSFAERLQRLAGGTTWREPMLGGGGKPGTLPAAHELAAALALARQQIRQPGGGLVPDPEDVGPDIALDVILGRTHYAVRVCQRVAAAMAQDNRRRAIVRCRPWLRVVVWAAYVEMVHGHATALRPSEVTAEDWELLTEAARRVLATLAEDAVHRAAQKWRRAG